jgi:hypothetical protein
VILRKIKFHNNKEDSMYGMVRTPYIGGDNVSGVGAEDYGPPAPSTVQQAGQVLKDFTGIPVGTLLLYGAGALLLYYIATSPQTE